MTAVEGPTDPPASLAQRLRAAVATDAFRAFLRLVFIAVYSLAFIAAGFGHWSVTTSRIIDVIVWILWAVLLVVYIADLRRSDDRRRYAIGHPAIPMLLIAPLFLILNWDAVWFIIVIVAYILELRQHSAGNAFAFSFCLIVFVGVLAALTMAELENDVAGSQFQGPSDAILWAFGSLLRINTGKTLTPATDDGRFLGVVVEVSAILVASMFTAKLVAWVIGSSKPAATKAGDEPEDATDVDSLRAELADMRLAMNQLSDALDRDRNGRPPEA